MIGAGNMAQSIISGMLACNWKSDQIIATAPSEKTRFKINNQFGINVSANNLHAATSDILFLCVKPAQMETVLREIAPVLHNQKPLLISVAAGIPMTALNRWSGDSLPIIRSIPNTPSSLGVGACGLFANEQVNSTQKALAEFIFQSIGIVEWVDKEELLNAVIAVSGSGPAYYFLFMEAMKNAGITLGLSQNAATRLTQQTILGAAKMATESTIDIVQLRQNVTSPGGTTEQAVNTFQQGNIEQLIHSAMSNAVKRAKDMAHELDK